MSAALLAFGAAAAAVIGAWELLAAVERTRVAAAWRRAIAPIVRAGREGVSPTVAERRRLGVLAAAVLAAAGWLRPGRARRSSPVSPGPRSRCPWCARAGGGSGRPWRRPRRSSLAPSPTHCRPATPSAGRWTWSRAGCRAPRGAAANAAHALQLGTGTETVLEDLRRRAGTPAWDAMIAGILLQRDAGGDLPTLLRDLALALEAAARQDRDALVATAQARFTARIVLVLPIGAALLAELAQPGLLSGLLTNPVSAWLTCLALVLQLIALFAVRRLTRSVVR